jgi:hypothetical protein
MAKKHVVRKSILNFDVVPLEEVKKMIESQISKEPQFPSRIPQRRTGEQPGARRGASLPAPTRTPIQRIMRRKLKSPVFTTAPATSAPALFCPKCTLPLVYRLTVIGGVQPPERWDYFACHRCGLFEYRQRSRSFRPMDALPTPSP